MKITNTLTETAREAVETALGYRFQNRALLTQAFTRASYCNEAKQIGFSVESNEVPEFFGDSILYAVVADYLFETHITVDTRGMHADCGEGQLTLEKISLTDKKYLSSRIRALGFDKYLLITTGNNAQQVTDTMAEDLFEALACAVWVDSDRNFERTRTAIRRLLDPKKAGTAAVSPSAKAKKAPASPATASKPAKSAIKEWCEKNHVEFFYSEPQKTGTEHEPSYTVTLTVECVGKTVGHGHSIKAAQTDAAEKMLQKIAKRDEMPSAPKKKSPATPAAHTAPSRATSPFGCFETPVLAYARTAQKPTTKPARAELKEWCEKRGYSMKYTTRQIGPEHEPTFYIRLTVTGLGSFNGMGYKKSEAEEDAARRAMMLIDMMML